MKLGLLTYNIACEWELEKIIEVCNKWGYAGVEFRSEAGHKHNVELETSKGERRIIKEKLEDAYLEASGVGTSCQFAFSEEKIRRQNIETGKRYVELAADIEAPRIRVFGDRFEKNADKEQTLKWVGEALFELNEFSKPYKVDVLIEMHGDFNFWRYAIKSIEYSGIPNLGLVYNCNPKDKVGESVRDTYSRVKHLIRHVHMHSFLSPYPYKEIMQLLKNDGYEGYFSAEIGEYSADPETVAGYHAKLYYEMLSTLK
jgi:sugar phosphate isomerase/epimerase